jgi:hypothetical protein
MDNPHEEKIELLIPITVRKGCFAQCAQQPFYINFLA